VVSMVERKRVDNGSEDTSCLARRMRQVRRVLELIDSLAPLRCHRTTAEIAEIMRERLGESFCNRTIYRDLRLLVDMGLAEINYLPPTSGSFDRAAFRLNLRPSESLQMAAIKAEEVPSVE
jgi:predicted DNA-binding transcriptional regulator YafY